MTDRSEPDAQGSPGERGGVAPTVRLTAEGRKAVAARHPWVYRDHVQSGVASSGALVLVGDEKGRPLGVAAWSARSKIALRFLASGRDVAIPTLDDLRARFREAVARRAPLREVTDAMRLVSSEADGFPGLVVDRYGAACVVSALTPFADVLLPDVVEWLREDVGATAVVARHDTSMRRLEGLPEEVRTLLGDEAVDEVEVSEHGLRFAASLRSGQKTGLFLDQRANRFEFGRRVRPGWRVLDAFTYHGGFALHAARVGAEVLATDESERAVAAAAANAARNGLDNCRFERANAFQLLRDLEKAGERFDAVVLDPPAFARSRGEVGAALRGYREINSRAARLVRPGGLLVTASCSYQVQEPVFEDMLRRAVADAGRDALVVGVGGQDVDHPVLLALPQSRYLKCRFLEVR